MADGLLSEVTTVFDYGCGRGDDLRNLQALGVTAAGWDPAHRPTAPRSAADVVNLGFVVNVIEDVNERSRTLAAAWGLCRQLLIVSARLAHERPAVRGTTYEDGVVTKGQTFQKFYTQEELRAWIDDTLAVRSVAAAPGVFYVFREKSREQTFLATRHMRAAPLPQLTLTTALFEHHREPLERLMRFVTARGRLPQAEERLAHAALVKEFASVERAFAVVRRVTGDEPWEKAAEHRAEDLLVYVALSRFGGRPRFNELGAELRWDIKALGGSYADACEIADRLLFQAGDAVAVDRACQKAGIGKLTPEALYVHVSALDQLPPLLRTYEGCARVLAGRVEGTTLVKLSRAKASVSYLLYPTFEQEAHPALASSIAVSLRRLDVSVRTYAASANPPILHRKETFLPASHPLHEKFAKLTRQEEKAGLFADAERIGTRAGWDAALQAAGVRLVGHRVVRAHGSMGAASDG